MGFLKEASGSVSEPISEGDIKKLIKLPPQERQRAIQIKLQDFFRSTVQNIKSNIDQAKIEILQEKREKEQDEMQKKREEMMKEKKKKKEEAMKQKKKQQEKMMKNMQKRIEKAMKAGDSIGKSK